MSALPKEIIRDFIKQQRFESNDGVLDLLKDMFKQDFWDNLKFYYKFQCLRVLFIVGVNPHFY